MANVADDVRMFEPHCRSDRRAPPTAGPGGCAGRHGLLIIKLREDRGNAVELVSPSVVAISLPSEQANR